MTAEAPPCEGGSGPACSHDCLSCGWARNQKFWKSEHPWLKARRCPSTQHVLHLYCRLCEDNGDLKPRLFRTTTAAQACHFKVHQATRKHKSAVDAGGATAHVAPLPAVFAKVLEAFDNGRAKFKYSATKMPGVGGRTKVRRMLFCLAEAVRERVRGRLAEARPLTFHSDSSKNRLLLLGQMCGDDLVPRHCLLGTADLGGDPSAAGLTTSMLCILKELCTPLLGGAGCRAQLETQTDATALAHVASIAEVFNADAAADEQLAGRMLQSKTDGGAPDDPGGGAPDGGGAPLHVISQI